mmetsp:Transcript_105543/g.186917  ORF Transcript_105543/g.186917 Transcript_105543/m.186917 type:complete len:99 (+) Transcript_105543:205-501(+)
MLGQVMHTRGKRTRGKTLMIGRTRGTAAHHGRPKAMPGMNKGKTHGMSLHGMACQIQVRKPLATHGMNLVTHGPLETHGHRQSQSQNQWCTSDTSRKP